MSEKTESPLVTPQEVADLMRVDPKTVVRWMQAGKMRYVKTPGRQWRAYREDLAKLAGLE